MAKKFNDLFAKMPKEAQEEVEAKAAIEVEEILISEMRKLAGFTQKDLAEKMGVTQSALSQLENQSDPQLSTLSKLVQALGGELELHVKYQDKDLKIKQTA
jgi:predicted transcriptional regulator